MCTVFQIRDLSIQLIFFLAYARKTDSIPSWVWVSWVQSDWRAAASVKRHLASSNMLVCFSPHDCVFRKNTRTVPSFLFFIFQKLFIKSLSNCSLLYEDYFILLPKSREWRRDCGFSSMCECQTVRKTCMVCGGSRICSHGEHRNVWKRRMVSGYVSMAHALV